ncbi:ABC transporter ATP-binding protein [Aquibacillus saliphilus]|uniref:ABC transporter ATP-binding protein n=1 Tax=Aquibacillus saliphilus TaxID=1909422 RepID=UPI001CEFDF3B|nr:ABC transporter ATP-binding protein [Aquibacillus saliphilus]
MSIPRIRVSQLKLFYEDDQKQPILDELNFELKDHENLLILGPSGCGKSTLTHCLNGLYPRELDGAMQGDISINGVSANNFASGELSLQVGVVFQDPETQFCMLTVADEVAFGLENKGIATTEMDVRIHEALGLVNMTAYKERVISTLSGGQKQKLALACILALEPEILVLDEPTANLDPKAAKEFIQTLDQLQQKKQFSLIVIEHQLDGWVSLIKRSIMMNTNGQIFFDGILHDGINQHRDRLEKLGIWIPRATKIALAIEKQGAYFFNTLPLTINELASYPISYNGLDKKKTVKADKRLLLKARDISWSKRNTSIIKQTNIDLYHGQFVAVLGANGSGKSSLSKLLAGIQKPSRGTIHLDDRPMKNWKEKDLRKKIGYVFQNPEHQFIADSVFDEVAFSLRLQEYSEREINNRVEKILNQCQLTGFDDYHPYTLSQGQKRRLSVATMIVDDQSLLILDEPTFGQDAHSTKQLLHLLVERYNQGTSIVMITHDMDIVHHYADRVLVMEKGHIVLDTTPEQLWNYPVGKLNQWQLELPKEVELKQLQQKDVGYVHT